MLPIGLITEIVRLEMSGPPNGGEGQVCGTVRALNTLVESPNELVLSKIGQLVVIIEESPDGAWLFVESERGEGWVPAQCIEKKVVR